MTEKKLLSGKGLGTLERIAAGVKWSFSKFVTARLFAQGYIRISKNGWEITDSGREILALSLAAAK